MAPGWHLTRLYYQHAFREKYSFENHRIALLIYWTWPRYIETHTIKTKNRLSVEFCDHCTRYERRVVCAFHGAQAQDIRVLQKDSLHVYSRLPCFISKHSDLMPLCVPLVHRAAIKLHPKSESDQLRTQCAHENSTLKVTHNKVYFTKNISVGELQRQQDVFSVANWSTFNFIEILLLGLIYL